MRHRRHFVRPSGFRRSVLRHLSTGAVLALAGTLAVPGASDAQAHEPGHHVARLVASMLGDTPLAEDLRVLSDEIGGRATGSAANEEAVAWGLERFTEAGVDAWTEAFEMPALWLERSARGNVHGDGLDFPVDLAAMPFSAPTPAEGVTGRLLDAGAGTPADFERLGAEVAGAFVLIETELLRDIEGLFAEYAAAGPIEARAKAAGALGVVYMSSRAPGLLYRHNATLHGPDARPMMVMERDDALRTMRLLRAGHSLELTATLDLETGGPYESRNVIAEIRGSTNPEQVVLIGAHLDSWDLGAGTLDNGANVALVIDIARQMRRLGVQPRRTIRFALWNGEEQDFNGSWSYVRGHRAELDDYVMASSFDIGCGRINGFFTGARPEIIPTVDRALEPVAGLGPFQQIDVPIVGTDNYDFMVEGVANLVGNHEAATYGPNYHAASDQLGQCDVRQVRTNAAVVAAVTWGLAEMDIPWGRQSAEDIKAMMTATDLADQMRAFGLWDAWERGGRGRSR